MTISYIETLNELNPLCKLYAKLYDEYDRLKHRTNKSKFHNERMCRLEDLLCFTKLKMQNILNNSFDYDVLPF